MVKQQSFKITGMLCLETLWLFDTLLTISFQKATNCICETPVDFPVLRQSTWDYGDCTAKELIHKPLLLLGLK